MRFFRPTATFFLLVESNYVLRSLILEDIKLSDCLPPILNLLGCCRLEGKND